MRRLCQLGLNLIKEWDRDEAGIYQKRVRPVST